MNFTLQLEKYGFTEYKPFDVQLMRIDPEVRKLCEQNKCGYYGKSHMCPPAIKGIEEWKQEMQSFENAVMVTKAYPTQGSFDIKGMFEGATDFGKTLSNLKQDIEEQYPEKRKMIFVLRKAISFYILELRA